MELVEVPEEEFVEKVLCVCICAIYSYQQLATQLSIEIGLSMTFNQQLYSHSVI